MKHLVFAAAALIAHADIVWAQAPAASDPGNLTRFSRGVKARYDNIKRDVVEAAIAKYGLDTERPDPWTM